MYTYFYSQWSLDDPGYSVWLNLKIGKKSKIKLSYVIYQFILASGILSKFSHKREQTLLLGNFKENLAIFILEGISPQKTIHIFLEYPCI